MRRALTLVVALLALVLHADLFGQRARPRYMPAPRSRADEPRGVDGRLAPLGPSAAAPNGSEFDEEALKGFIRTLGRDDTIRLIRLLQQHGNYSTSVVVKPFTEVGPLGTPVDVLHPPPAAAEESKTMTKGPSTTKRGAKSRGEKAADAKRIGGKGVPSLPIAGPVNLIFSFLPPEVELNRPFQFGISLSSRHETPVGITLDDSNGVSFTPKVVSLTGHETQMIEAVVQRAPGGLSEIVALVAAGGGEARTTLNVGFSAGLQLSGLSRFHAGSTQHARIRIVDFEGRDVRLGGAVRVRVNATRMKLRESPQGIWLSEIVLTTPMGAASTVPFELASEGWSDGAGTLTASVLGADYSPLHEQAFTIPISATPWTQLGMTIGGGSLCAAYVLLRRRRPTRTPKWKVLGAAVIASVLAYLVADWNLLGIKSDTTSLRAFAAIGFLFSYVGLDTVLKKTFRLSES